MRKYWNFILYSNVFISLCAAAYTMEMYLLARKSIDWYYVFFVFFSTLAFYIFPALQTGNFMNEHSERHTWVRSHTILLRIFFTLSLLAIVLIVLFLSIEFIFVMIPIAIIAFAYFIPQTHIRSIVFLKTTIVAFVWTVITSLFPFLLLFQFNFANFLAEDRWLIVLQNFFFMYPLCLIFNVRDVEADKGVGVSTFVGIYGIHNTILFCTCSLIISFILVYISNFSAIAKWVIYFSISLSASIIGFASTKRSDHYYSLYIDGMILLQASLIIIYYLI